MHLTRAVLALVLVVGCSKEAAKPSDSDKSDKSDPDKPLTAPKVKAGKIDLADKCNDKYPIDKEGGTITSCAINADIEVGDITCAKNGRPVADADGTLQSCGLKGVHEAGPLKCHKGLSLHPDGKIKTCILAEPVTSAGKKCKTSISFKSDGSFDKCT